MTIFNWLLIGLWSVFLIYWFISAFEAKKNLNRISRWLGWRAIIVAAVLLLLGLRNTTGLNDIHLAIPTNPFLQSIGVILCFAGIVFAIWARWHLGRNWGMPMSVKEKPELVTTGPYAYVRHPIYTGVLTAILGSVLASEPWWLITFVFCAAYFIYSAYQEEKLMRKEFPDQYPGYKQRTKMLIPFVF